MKKLIIIAVFFLSLFSLTADANSFMSQDDPSISIGVNDFIIISDVNVIKDKINTKGMSDRALEQVNLAHLAYEKGVNFLKQENPTEAIVSFKSAFKNYKRAKLDADILNYPNLQLAVAHSMSEAARDKKKVGRYLDLVTKSIYKEKDWSYNIAILNYLNKNEIAAAELLETTIKKNKFFLKAYGSLIAVYQNISNTKKAEKTISRLENVKNTLAEKERKQKITASKAKQSQDISNKPPKKSSVPPKGIELVKSSLKAKDDSKSIMKSTSITAFDDRSRKKVSEAQSLFDEGILFFNKSEFDLAIKSFKSSLKKFTQAKANQQVVDYVTANLAMSYFMSSNERNQKKVTPLLETLSKPIFEDRDWSYNAAVMYGLSGSTDKSLELLKSCAKLDKYFLLSYQNQISLYNGINDLKSAKKAFSFHEKYKNELTEIYKEYVSTGKSNPGVNLSFLEGAIFRVFLGSFSEYNMPIDIYLHDDLIMVPLGDDFYNFICSNFTNYKKAESYLRSIKLNRDDYTNSFIIAFKDGVRTDFAIE